MSMTFEDKKLQLQAKLQKWHTVKTDEDLLKEDEFILMANYLSEIERMGGEMKRNVLAKKIGTSASYLTQVFRGDKPLNFYTIAKLQRALKVRFSVTAIPNNQSVMLINAKKIDFTPTDISNLYSRMPDAHLESKDITIFFEKP